MLTEGHATVNRVLRWRRGILTRPARHDERDVSRRPREQRRSSRRVVLLRSVALGAVATGRSRLQ